MNGSIRSMPSSSDSFSGASLRKARAAFTCGRPRNCCLHSAQAVSAAACVSAPSLAHPHALKILLRRCVPQCRGFAIPLGGLVSILGNTAAVLIKGAETEHRDGVAHFGRFPVPL